MPMQHLPPVIPGKMYSRMAQEDIRGRGSGDNLAFAALRVAWIATKLACRVLVFSVRQWQRQRRLDRVRGYIRGENG